VKISLGTVSVLDANVLYPAPLRDFLLRLAAARFFKPRWSAQIHEEWIKNLLANNAALSREKLEATRDAMDGFFEGALITDYAHLIPTLTNDPKDRHVLATAITARATSIVTFNLKDFRPADLTPHGVCAIAPDTFITGLYHASPELMVTTVKRHREILKRPARTPEEYLGDLTRNHLPQTAALLEKHLAEM
jgi:predicted nucleic acid-binding protein